MDRIEDGELTPVPFQRPEDVNLHQHLARSFGVFQGDGEVDTTVRFAPSVARYVMESQWHPSQKLRDQKDGSVIAEFFLGSSQEIKQWILSFGRHAVVLEPDSLRNELVSELDASRDAYRSKAPSQEQGASGNHLSVD